MIERGRMTSSTCTDKLSKMRSLCFPRKKRKKKKRKTISDAENEQRYKYYTVYGIIKTCTLFVVLLIMAVLTYLLGGSCTAVLKTDIATYVLFFSN